MGRHRTQDRPDSSQHGFTSPPFQVGKLFLFVADVLAEQLIFFTQDKLFKPSPTFEVKKLRVLCNIPGSNVVKLFTDVKSFKSMGRGKLFANACTGLRNTQHNKKTCDFQHSGRVSFMLSDVNVV